MEVISVIHSIMAVAIAFGPTVVTRVGAPPVTAMTLFLVTLKSEIICGHACLWTFPAKYRLRECFAKSVDISNEKT